MRAFSADYEFLVIPDKPMQPQQNEYRIKDFTIRDTQTNDSGPDWLFNLKRVHGVTNPYP